MPLPPNIADYFLWQAKACDDLGSPFTANLCRLLAERLNPTAGTFARRIFAWTGVLKDDALALRAAGALNALARSGRISELTIAYPPNPFDPERLWRAIGIAMAREDSFLSAYLDGPPQTNEVARSGTILGGALVIVRETGLPLEVFEIGSSAGLNLNFDIYRYDLGDRVWGHPDSRVHIASRWEGDGLPPLDQPLTVAARAGCDVRPIDPASPADRERLLSYIWPDQAQRVARTEAALMLAASARSPVTKADAADWVERGLDATPRDGVVRVVFHTIVWPYLPHAIRDRIAAAIRAAGARATRRSPLAWLSVEPDEVEGSAGIRLTIWPGGETRALGRADFHGRWNRWRVSARA
jgi:hypothetical protein